MTKTFTAKLEGKQTKFEIEDNLTLHKLKTILSHGLKHAKTGMELDIVGLNTGLIVSVIQKPAALKNADYVENIDLDESAIIAGEINKIIPLEKFLKAVEPLMEMFETSMKQGKQTT